MHEHLRFDRPCDARKPAVSRAGANRHIRPAAALAALILIGAPFVASARRAGPTVGVAGQKITVDGRATFLVGVSLFDALGPTPPRDQDLDALRNWGVNTVRVWAHWHEPIYRKDGALSAQGRSRLLALVERLQTRRLVLELVLLRPGQLAGQGYPAFASDAARARAVGEITTALRDYRNVIFDLYNEHDHPDGPISHAAARALRDIVKAKDPARIVTLSSTGNHLMGADNKIGESEAGNLREEAGQDDGCVGVDVVAVHLPRTADWAAAAAPRVAALRAALAGMGRNLPVYLNEEQRAAAPSVIPPDAYRQAFVAAQQAGAAGWLFHTAAGFDLHARPFLDALTKEERDGIARLKKALLRAS